MKDASAAVYGSRAAGGVILVTTKKGKLGAPQISYSGTIGITNSVATPKMLDTYNYGRLWNAVRAGDPTEVDLNPTFDLFQQDELNAMKKLNYDLLDKYWKTALAEQLENLKGFYQTYLKRKTIKGDSYDSSNNQLTMTWQPHYYFYGLTQGNQDKNPTLPQNVGWEDYINNGANGTFDPAVDVVAE